MQKVMVFGNAGGGKSTLSQRLADITGLPWVPPDAIKYSPGGDAVPPKAFKKATKSVYYLRSLKDIERFYQTVTNNPDNPLPRN
jgi:predicted kinase